MSTPKTTTFTNNEHDGYKFTQASTADQLAYLKLSDEEVDAILNKAQENAAFVQNEATKKKLIHQCITDELNKKAQALDANFQKGFQRIFDTLKNPKVSQEDKNRCAADMLKELGINADPENVKTEYHKGPPEMYIISFVLRPQPSVADENSKVNQLATAYKDSCDPDKAEEFDIRWKQHQVDARNPKPLMDPKEFEEAADSAFEQMRAKHTAPSAASPMTNSHSNT